MSLITHTLELPLAPSVNRIWQAKTRWEGKPYYFRRTDYMRWRKLAMSMAWEQKPKGGWGCIAGEFSAELTVDKAKAPNRSDLDNRIKAVLDLAQAMALIADDRHCQSVRAVWGECRLGMKLVIQELAPPPEPPQPMLDPAKAKSSKVMRDRVARAGMRFRPLSSHKP